MMADVSIAGRVSPVGISATIEQLRELSAEVRSYCHALKVPPSRGTRMAPAALLKQVSTHLNKTQPWSPEAWQQEVL